MIMKSLRFDGAGVIRSKTKKIICYTSARDVPSL